MSRRDQTSDGDAMDREAPAPDSASRHDIFDIAGSDPDLIHSGRIPDPQPEHTPLFRAMARALEWIEERLRARGGKPLRNGIRFFWLLLAAIGVLLLVGPIINKPLDFDDVIDSAKVDEVDWVARDAAFDYEVERTAAGRFAVTVDESYTADFRNGPEHEIRRTVVTEFKGHDARFALHAATIDGEPAKVTVDRGPATTTVRVERSDGRQLEGRQRVTLSYELHDLVTTETDTAGGRTVDQWSWPVLAPSWPQATKGVEVSFTLPREADDALIRAPQAYVGWLLVSGTERLTPDETTADTVSYSFSNDQTLPPNADIWIDAVFEPGTFTQPPKTTFFWIQTYGPLLPLALLVVLLLFALAARRVVWADSAGDPWYLPRSEPPEGLSASEAARLLRKSRHLELIDALAGKPRDRDRRRSGRPRIGSRRSARAAAEASEALEQLPGSRDTDQRNVWLASVARAGHRAGRVGNLPAVWARVDRLSRPDPIMAKKLRWAPDSYVRDTFLLASLAIALLQWGLLRQLSHQVILLVVWWPAAFVMVSTALALATMSVVIRPRPLTPAGALVNQQLKGIDVYARATRLMDRGPVDDPLLSYAMLYESPRRAGDAVTALASGEAGDPYLDRGWRSESFVSAPAVLAFAASLAVLAGSIVTVSALPAPYESGADHISEYNDIPGTVRTQVEGFDIRAELARDADGRARLEVVEHQTVDFDAGGGNVPQFVREWPSSRLGQSLGFSLESVTIDGDAVPYREMDEPQTRSTAMVTQLEDALEGAHEVAIRYSLASPVVEASDGPRTIQQLRWTALYSFWEHEYYTTPSNPFAGSAPVRPIRVEFVLAPDLVDAALRGGWIDSDSDRAEVPGENGNWFQPWTREASFVSDHDQDLHNVRIGSKTARADGSALMVLDVDAAELVPRDDYEGGTVDGPGSGFVFDPLELDKYNLGLSSDLGVRIDFVPGTFSGIAADAYDGYLTAYRLPYALMLGLAGLVIAASLGTLAFGLRSKRRASASLKTIAFGAIPIAAVAQCVLFFWAIGPMAGDDGRIPGAMAAGGFMIAAVIGQMIAVVKRSGRPTTRV